MLSNYYTMSQLAVYIHSCAAAATIIYYIPSPVQNPQHCAVWRCSVVHVNALEQSLSASSQIRSLCKSCIPVT